MEGAADAVDWANVPEDVLEHVLDRLPLADVASCGSVCRAWRDSSRSDWLWSRRCARRWCLHALAHFASDSPIRRGWESGYEGAALAQRLRELGVRDEEELGQAADTIGQLRKRAQGVLWWSLFRDIETKPLSASWLRVGDHVDCRWGEQDNSMYNIPRLRGALRAGYSAAHWEAQVLEFDAQKGSLHVHYGEHDPCKFLR